MEGRDIPMLSGHENITNRLIGTLRVLGVERRKPSLAWRTECEKCGTVGIFLHQQLQSGTATCRNVNCGRTQFASPTSARSVSIAHGRRSADSTERREFDRREQRREEQTVDFEIPHVLHPTAPCGCAKCVTSRQAAREPAPRNAPPKDIKQAVLAALQSEYNQYVQKQVRSGLQVANFEQWIQTGDVTVGRIIELVTKVESR